MTSSPHFTPPAVVVTEVRKALDARRPAEETIRTIRRLLEPPVRCTPVELTDRGWPVLRSTCDRSDTPEEP